MPDQIEKKGQSEQEEEAFFLDAKEDPWGLSSLYNKEKGVWFVPWMPEAAFPNLGVVTQALAYGFHASRYLETGGADFKKMETVPAIIDTGVLVDHPLLKGHVIDTQDFTGEGPEDRLGHGTHMAIRYLFGNPFGQLISIKVKSKRAASQSEQVESFVKGIRYAIDKQIKRLSISVGWPVHCKDVGGAEKLCSIIKEAIEQHNMELLVVGEALCPAECHPSIKVMGQILNGREQSFMIPTVTYAANLGNGRGRRRLMPYELWKQRIETLRSTLYTPQTASDWIFTGFTLQDHSGGSLELLTKAAGSYTQAFALDPHAVTTEGVPSTEFRDLYATYYMAPPPTDLRPSILACFDQVLKLDPKLAEAWRSKGFVLSCLLMHQEAIKCFDQALALNEADGQAWFSKGVSLAALGKHDDTVRCYDKTLELDATNVGAWVNKGAELFNSGKYRQAVGCYDHALTINAKMVIAWHNKGEALLKLGERDDAMVCFNRALEISPKFPPALQRVGPT